MNREEVDFVFTAHIGSELRLGPRGYTVLGRFAEIYFPRGAKPVPAHVLSLSGMEEIGAECRDEGWYLWHSELTGNYSQDSPQVKSRQSETIEKGRILRDKSEGVVGSSYSEYTLSLENGRLVFIPTDGHRCEIWYTKEIRPEDVQLL